MEASKRRAFLNAMLVQLGECGYQEVSVERALADTGTSEAQFSAEFEGKDECLFAAYEQLTGWVVEEATADCGDDLRWPERIRVGLISLLEALAAEPLLAKVMTRSFPGIRPSTYERYVDLLACFVPFVRDGRDFSGIGDELPTEVELLAVGAAESIIFSEVDGGRVERLPKMMPEILFSILVPFIGPDRASEEMRSASAAL